MSENENGRTPTLKSSLRLKARKFQAMEMIFFSVAIGLILFCVMRGVQLRTDDTLIAYGAPDMREMGAPVSLRGFGILSPNNCRTCWSTSQDGTSARYGLKLKERVSLRLYCPPR